MKKIISIILSLTLLFSATVCVFAAECSHNYLRTRVEANCCEKAHMLYSCRRCGYSYKVYDDSYETPESFYILASSLREDNTLTVKVEIFNTPGLSNARVPVKYNSDTLAVREIINGDIWESYEITKIDLSNNPFGFLAEDYDLNDGPNYKSGTFFTVVFDIIDPEGEYGISFPYETGDFPTLDLSTNTIIKNKPTFISIVGKSELGDHSYSENTVPPTCEAEGYTEHLCTVCGDSYKDGYTEALDHSWEFTRETVAPSVFDTGEALYTCVLCGNEKTEVIPALERYMKGDINNDGALNSLDSNLLKRFLVKLSPTPQQTDAADVFEDGKVNAQDSYILKKMISGQ